MSKKIEVSEYQIALETKKRLSSLYLGFPIEELSALDILKITKTYSEVRKSLEEQKQKKEQDNMAMAFILSRAQKGGC